MMPCTNDGAIASLRHVFILTHQLYDLLLDVVRRVFLLPALHFAAGFPLPASLRQVIRFASIVIDAFELIMLRCPYYAPPLHLLSVKVLYHQDFSFIFYTTNAKTPPKFSTFERRSYYSPKRDSISCQASSKPSPFSEENTSSGSPGSMSNVSLTIFLCLSHLPFGILSAFVATTITGML